jgi:hypothetical protein
MATKEERLEILKMIGDGVISAEEGERLLDAVAAGEKEARPDLSPLSEMVRGSVEVGRGFAGVGKSIAIAVDQAVRSALGDPEAGRADLRNETDLDLLEGTELAIENIAVGEGSITLEPGRGERCRIRGEAEHQVVWEKGRARILWPGGDLVVVVPETASRVSAAAHHGHVRARGIAVPLDVETLHGHLELRGVCGQIEAETLAGNVFLEVALLDGKSEVTTMAGSIEVVLLPGFSGIVKASTLGGDISIEDGLGTVKQRPLGQVPRSAVIEVGDSPERSSLEIETASGSIVLRRAE